MADRIQDNLECPLCFEQFKQPKNLSCGHTFCLNCLERHVQAKGHVTSLKCPECRQDTNFQGNLNKLPNSIVVIRLIDNLKTNEKSLDTPQNVCKLCEGANPLVSFCKTCPISMCSGCTHGHKMIPVLAGHQVYSIAAIKEEYRGRVLKLKSIQSRFKEKMARLVKMSDETTESCLKIKYEIHSEADKLLQVINYLKTNLLEKVDDFLGKKLSTIEVLSDEMRIQTCSIDNLLSCFDAVEAKSDFEVLDVYKADADNLISVSLEELKPKNNVVLDSRLQLEPSEEFEKFQDVISLGNLFEG